MDSAKRPLGLVWKNPEPLDNVIQPLYYSIILKNGDYLRQDMLTLQVIRIMDSIWLNEGNKTLRTLHLYLCVHAIFTRRYCMSTMSNKLVNGKIEPKGIKELRVYEKAVLKLVSNPHYVQERETSQFYKTILKASNGYRRLDCKLETYPWISFACGIEETNSLSQVSQTGNFPLHLFLCTKSFEITFLSILSPKLFGSWSTCTGT